MVKPLPSLDVPVVDTKTGQMTQVWFDYFFQHQRLSQMPDVSPVAPTNGQVLIYNSTTKLYTPGAN
jgi:hypothetical protein